MAVAESVIREIVRHPLDYEGWTIQGLGMLRLPLTDDGEVRLHIWDPNSAINDQLSAHDHPWDIEESMIYFGVMRDQRYKVGDTGDIPVRRAKVMLGPGNDFSTEVTPGGMSTLGDLEEFGPGDIYSITAEEFHNSFPLNGTITVIKRRLRPDLELASGSRVANMCWAGEENWQTDGFNRDATAAEILHFTGLVDLSS